MKLLLIDSNIVFSAIVNPESKIGEILFDSEETFEFCSVELLVKEVDGFNDKLLARNLNIEEIETAKERIYEVIELYEEGAISFDTWMKALRLVRDTDIDDIAFVALSLYLAIPIWTGDKKLINGLAEKGYYECLTTEDVYELKNIIESSNP